MLKRRGSGAPQASTSMSPLRRASNSSVAGASNSDRTYIRDGDKFVALDKWQEQNPEQTPESEALAFDYHSHSGGDVITWTQKTDEGDQYHEINKTRREGFDDAGNKVRIVTHITEDITYPNGNRHRYNERGELDGGGGPAFIGADGTVEHWKNDKLHREDGPARVYPDGTEEWHQEGKRHREDGPAVVWSNGREEWWLNGRQVKEEWHKD